MSSKEFSIDILMYLLKELNYENPFKGDLYRISDAIIKQHYFREDILHLIALNDSTDLKKHLKSNAKMIIKDADSILLGVIKNLNDACDVTNKYIPPNPLSVKNTNRSSISTNTLHFNCNDDGILVTLLDDKRFDPMTHDGLPLLMAVKQNNMRVVSTLLDDDRVDPSVNDNAVLKLALKLGFSNIATKLYDDGRTH